jgi:hypothetical protein
MALQERAPARRRPRIRPARRRGRSPFALGLAVVALLAALAAAVGPAEHVHANYAWPPQALPDSQPRKLWYTPLVLSRHEPASLTATLPCAAPALPDATQPTLVLATTNGGAGGLTVERRAGHLSVRLGDTTLTSAPAPANAGSGCSYRLNIRDRAWSLTGGPGSTSGGGSLEHMPFVAGLFSALDLRSAAQLRVDVAAVVLDAKPRLWQSILWALAALAALTSLVLVTRPRKTARFRVRLGVPDIAVIALLLVWWIVGPAFFDDGWVAARQQNYDAAGGFSAYYSSFGVNLPLDYWVEWLEHWLANGTNALLLQRLPALACLLGTWAVCRWTLGRLLPAAASSVVRWALAGTFAVGALAWGMTFRPEPVVALLVVEVLACTVTFVERPRAVAIAGALVLTVLALTAHPSGIVALAPLLAALPSLVAWVRANVAAASTILASTAATLVVLATLGSDLHQRRADTASLRAFGDETAGWRDELSRYQLLSQSPYATPARRVTVALILLAVAAYLLRRRRGERPLLGLPARTLGLSLLVFFLTPTKWPWHFGALIGLAALAVAAESERLREDATSTPRWHGRPFLVIGAAVAAAGWAWSPRTPWGELDLRTMDWTLGFESRLTLSKLGGALPVILLVVLALAAVARHRARRLSAVPWRAALWSVPLVAASIVGFTVAVLVDDSARTSSWTLARQNLDTLAGNLRCGLADDAVVPVRASMRALQAGGAATRGRPPAWLPPTPVAGVQPLTLASGAASSWFPLPARGRIGFFLAGVPVGEDHLSLEWARRAGATVKPLGRAGVAEDAGTDTRPDLVYWRFYAAADLPAVPAEANVVRFVLATSGRPGTAIGLTPPVTYTDQSLATAVRRDTPTLAVPNLLPYVPCVRQPEVDETAQMPGAILAFRTTMWPVGAGTSPFDGVTDVYPLVRLPLSDSADRPGDVALYEVDRRIEGATLAPAVPTRGGA